MGPVMDRRHSTPHPVPAPDGAADQGRCGPVSQPATAGVKAHAIPASWQLLEGRAVTGHRHRWTWMPLTDVTFTIAVPDPPAYLGICDICGMPGLATVSGQPLTDEDGLDGRPGSGEHAIPAALRSARFVPRQRAGRREPMRVTPGMFTAAGLPVPANPAQWNVYQLTQRRGWPWSPAVDCLASLRGSEILPGPFVTVDCDTHLAIDGSVWIDGFRWFADRATEAGEILDLSACLAVRSPGHPGRPPDQGHGPGWHLWWAADPDYPVRAGPLPGCSAAELKTRCTAPGSPGYEVRHCPDVLPVLPRWIAALAGPPRRPVAPDGPRQPYTPGGLRPRLRGVLAAVLGATEGERNRVLHWAACRCAEMVADGALDTATAAGVLEQAGLRAGLEYGEVTGTIRSALDGAAR
jgi:hypothetical protein